jgi:signal transduction histidine kinase/HPt (histidine-containing phosphotransfer) domain-containing protein/ActR/RegA family two-component response regulator
MSASTLDAAEVDTLFPFHIALDAQGRLVRWGRTLARILPTLGGGDPLEAHFELVRPAGPTSLEALTRAAATVVVLRARAAMLTLRGQVLVRADGALFVGTPWVSELGELRRLGLKLGDFAVHDAMLDHMTLLQSKNTALADVQRLARRLEEEKSRAERLYGEVAELSAWLSTLVENLPFGVLLEDARRRVVMANQALTSSVEVQREAAQRLADPQGFVARTEAIAAARAPVLGEQLDHADGRRLERDSIPIAAPDGGHAILWQYRDETRRRHADDELRATKAAAEAANRAKADFLAMVSHEMRTPLGVIVGLTELLGEMEWDEERGAYLERLSSNADALLALIEDLLDFAKLEAGQIRLELAPYAPLRIGADVLGALSMRAETKGLALTFVTDPSLDAPLLVDGARVRQVLVNLVSNAIKFTARGRVELLITTTAEDAAGLHVRYAVRDTGPGIPDALKARVFERFVRADSPENRRAGGAGLGLDIVRSLVELMGGHVTLEDAPAGGALFSFTLVHPRPLPELAPSAAIDAPPRGALVGGPGAEPRVLVAEDNEDNRRLLERQLARLGCVVEFAPDGLAAFERLSAAGFDLLLTDLEMPRWDGFELARQLRSAPFGARIPIIALSAHALPGHRQRCIDAGMDDYLTKPVRRATLALALSRWTGEHTQTSAPTGSLPLVTSTGDIIVDTLDVSTSGGGDDAAADARREHLVDPAEASGPVLPRPDPDVADLVGWYVDERRREAAELRVLLEAGAFDRLRRVGHNLAGSAAAYGLPQLGELGRGLEDAARSEALDRVVELLGAIERYLARVQVPTPDGPAGRASRT